MPIAPAPQYQQDHLKFTAELPSVHCPHKAIAPQCARTQTGADELGLWTFYRRVDFASCLYAHTFDPSYIPRVLDLSGNEEL